MPAQPANPRITTFDELLMLMVSIANEEVVPYVHIYQDRVRIGLLGKHLGAETEILTEELRQPIRSQRLTEARDKLAAQVGAQLCQTEQGEEGG